MIPAALRSKLSALSPRDRRALGWGGAVVLGVLGWLVLAGPYLDHVSERRALLERERQRLEDDRALVRSADREFSTMEAGGQRLRDLRSRLLSRESHGVATAQLNQYVADRARAARVRLTNTEPAAADSSGPLERVTLHLEAESDLRGLLELLASLEHGRHLLLGVSDLVIQARTNARRGPPGEGPEVLSFSFAVTGFRLIAGDEGTSFTAYETAEGERR